MARSIWKGAIAFGLVNIPVSLSSAEVRPEIQLHMVDSKNHARIRNERVNVETGEDVPWDRLVKGYEHDDGQFILLTDVELEAVQPKLTKLIEISQFVSLEDIDPMLFEKPYYLEPEKRGSKAYVLLREALRQTGRAGISKVVIRTREYLTAMFVRDEALILMLLRFPQEIQAATKLDLPSSRDMQFQPTRKEMDLAVRLIGEMTEQWAPQDYHDEYRQALMDYIEKKIGRGESVADVKQPLAEDLAETSGGKILDLADYLERSFKTSASTVSPERKSKPKVAARKATKKDGATKSSSKNGRRSA